MRGISFTKFKRQLKSLNPDFVLMPGINKDPKSLGAMVFLNCPGHRDSDKETGLYELLAVPSPAHFREMPLHDLAYMDPKDDKAKWVRGYRRFAKAICSMRHPITNRLLVNAARVRAMFPEAFRPFQSERYTKDLKESLITEPEKLRAKFAQFFRPMSKPEPLPAGWTPGKTLYI